MTGDELPVTGKITWQKGIDVGYLDQYADIPDGMRLIEFLHTAYANLYERNDKMTALYTEYAETADDKLLERAGRIQEYLEANNFYDIETEIERIISGLGSMTSAAIMKWLRCPVANGQRLFWLNYCCNSLT